MNKEYDVFISYNSVDKKIVESIAAKIRDAGLNPFLDKWHLIPGAPWPDALEEAILSSKSFTTFFGASGVGPWQHEEMRAALIKAVKAPEQHNVIPVLLPGSRLEDIPQFLSSRTWVDLRNEKDFDLNFQQLLLGIKGSIPSSQILTKQPTDPIDLHDIPSQTQSPNTTVMGDINGSIVFTAGRDVILTNNTIPVFTSNLINVCDEHVQRVLDNLAPKYIPSLYVDRIIQDKLDAFLNNQDAGQRQNCFLLIAPAGSGKTNLLCELARRQKTQQPIIYLIGSSIFLDEGTGLAGAIRVELENTSSKINFRSTSECMHTLNHLATNLGRDTILIIDAINEYEHPVRMRKALRSLLDQIVGKRIKAIVACRDYYWGVYRDAFKKTEVLNPESLDGELNDIGIEFNLFTTSEYETALELYIDHFEITGRPIGYAAEQCRHPLLLRFFCEAYSGQDIGEDIKNIRLKELFDHYWEQKLVSISKHMIRQDDVLLEQGRKTTVGSYLERIASYMFANHIRSVPQQDISKATKIEEDCSDPRSLYGRVRDEYIILEEVELGRGPERKLYVAFVYEEFMEYVIARSLLSSWFSAGFSRKDILETVENLTREYDDFVQIFGVMIYLAIMLKERWDIELWQILLSRGEIWQKVVFESIKKLPHEQLSQKVYNLLQNMLLDSDDEIKMQILDVLKSKRVGIKSPPHLIDVVAEYATNANVAISRRALLALGNMQASISLPVLISALVRNSSGVVETAPLLGSTIKALVTIGDPAINPLNTCLESDNWRLSHNAALILGRLGIVSGSRRLVQDLKQDNPEIRKNAEITLSKLPIAVAESIIPALKDINSYVRLVVARTLQGMKWSPPDDLLSWYLLALQNWDACVDLGNISVNPLIFALQDENPNVRWRAAKGLGELHDTRAILPLIDTFRYGDDNLKQIAIEALVRIGKQSVDPLIRQLDNESLDVKIRAIDALGKLGNSIAISPLINALSDKNNEVKWRAAMALGQIGDDVAVGHLAKTLRDSDKYVRASAAWALGRFINVKAADHLISALQDKDPYVRRNVVQALGQIGDVRAIKHLFSFMFDPDKYVRRGAEMSLGNFRNRQVIEAVLSVLRSDDGTMKRTVVKIVDQLKVEKATEDLIIQALVDDNAEVRLTAARMLQRNRWLPPDDEMRCRFNIAMQNWEACVDMGELAINNLVDVLQSGWKTDVRCAAIMALKEIGSSRAVESIIAVLNDVNRNVREDAVDALEEIGDERGIDALLNLGMGDHDIFFRNRIVKTLSSFDRMLVRDKASVVFREANMYQKEKLRALFDDLNIIIKQE